MSSNHGGKRRGAGRRPRATNARTREIADRAFEQGITPLEVMLDNMRFYHGKAEEALRVLLVGNLKTAEGDEPNQDIIDGIKDALELRKRAGDEAARAAPYMHTRMGYDNTDYSADPDFVPLAERLAYYTRRDEIAAAGDKVTELKPQGDQRTCPNGSEHIPPPTN